MIPESKVLGDGCFHTGPTVLSLTGTDQEFALVKNNHLIWTGCKDDQFSCSSGLCVAMEQRWKMEATYDQKSMWQILKAVFQGRSTFTYTQPTQMWRESRLWWRKRRSGLSNCSSKAWIFEGEYFISALDSSQMPLFMILQDKPPPPLEAGSLVKILVNVDIERILTINEVDKTLAESIYFFFSCCNPRGGAKVLILSKFNPYWQLFGLGGRRFWDSAAYWAGVEGSTCEGMQPFFVALDPYYIGNWDTNKHMVAPIQVEL